MPDQPRPSRCESRGPLGRPAAAAALAARSLHAIDSQLAATALKHNLILVTRNLGDFDLPGIRLIGPWRENQP
jgi:predicted nucleic acid-binding protein